MSIPKVPVSKIVSAGKQAKSAAAAVAPKRPVEPYPDADSAAPGAARPVAPPAPPVQSAKSAILEVGIAAAAGVAKGAAKGAAKGSVVAGAGAAPGAAVGAVLEGAKEAAFAIARNPRTRKWVLGFVAGVAAIAVIVGAMQALIVSAAFQGIAGYNNTAAQQSALASDVDETEMISTLSLADKFGLPWTLITSARRENPDIGIPELTELMVALDEVDSERKYRSMDAGGVYLAGEIGRIVQKDSTLHAEAAGIVKETYVAGLVNGLGLADATAVTVYDRALRWWLGEQLGCTAGATASSDAAVTLTVKNRPMNADQEAIARTIIGIVKSVLKDAPQSDQVRAAEISMATGIVESVLTNGTEKVDATSLGVFQQQDWWGTDEQRTRPDWATARFLRALLATPGWNSGEPGAIAQKVQVSAFPDEYAKRMPEAKGIVSAFWADSPALPVPADIDLSGVEGPTDETSLSCVSGSGGWVAPFNGAPRVNSWFGPRVSPGNGGSTNHGGVDFGVPGGDPLLSAGDGIVSGVGSDPNAGCGYWITVMHAEGAETRYCHMARKTSLSVGDTVKGGQEVGLCGTTGNSTGNHLHFNVNVDGKPIDPVVFMLEHGVDFRTLPYYAPIGPW